MLTEKFYEVLKHEGVVSITSWGVDEPHVTNTWNSFVVVTDDERLLIPAAGLRSTEGDVNVNNRVKVAFAKFISSGSEFDIMVDKFPFANRVLEITVTSSKQLL